MVNSTTQDTEETRARLDVMERPTQAAASSGGQSDERNGEKESAAGSQKESDNAVAGSSTVSKNELNQEVNEKEGEEHIESSHSMPAAVVFQPADVNEKEDEVPLPEASLHSKGNEKKSRNSRRQRNSLALRKNTPTKFSFGMALSSLSSRGLQGLSSEVQAFSDGTPSSSTKSGHSRLTKGGTRVSISRRDRRNLLRSTCLNPNLSLGTQLMLSFGFVSITMISFVMVVCIAVTILSGQSVNKSTLETFDDLALKVEGRTVRYMAEFLTHRLIPSDLVEIVWEATRERIAGYPNAPGFAEDVHVPFYDIDSKTNRYPIVGQPLPLEWQLKDFSNVNEANYQEHIHDRWRWYISHDGDIGPSTQSAVYLMQGACDPDTTGTAGNPASHMVYPNCTDANNDLRTGGVVAPTDTNELLHRKSSDLSPLLKALYEYQQDIKSLGIAFSNSGAGSTVRFPHYEEHSHTTYISHGCDWMRKANPFAPEQNIGDEDMINRCHPAGTKVSYREYNPMEQDWCQRQALEPQKIHSDGPHLDPSWHHSTGEYFWTLTVGRAIYDRVTNEFIGCIQVNVVLSFLEQVLLDSRVTESSHVTVVRWDDAGTVIASTARNMAAENQTLGVDQLGVGVTKESYLELKNLVNYDERWDSSELRNTYESFVIKKDGYFTGAYPMPPPPASYDPAYRPEFFAIKSIFNDDVFGQLYSSQESVDDKVDELVRLSLLIGVVGIIAVLLITAMVSNRLTSPLRFMNDVASEIVNNYVNSNEDGIEFSQPANYGSCCTPKTEVSEVVAEFQKMVSRFSGTSNAKAMKRKYTEVKNRFDMFDEFADVYQSRQEGGFPYMVKEGDTEQVVGGVDTGAQNTVLNRKHQGTLFPQEGGVSPKPELKRQPSDSSLTYFFAKKRRNIMSPLFFWVVFLIATPLLLTTITLSTIVMYRISSEFPVLVEDAKADFVSLDLFALQVYVSLRADFVSEVTSRSTRDLHLASRYLSWLLFDGINRSDSFTDLTTGADACKHFPDISECPFIQEFPCDCSWRKDEIPYTCRDYDEDSRYLQKTFFTCESLGTMLDGDRNSTSFPDVSFSQSTTAWWSDVNSVPGSQKGSSAAGYDTTYDRLRVLSAMPLYQSLSNYDHEKHHVIGTFVAMEDDGMFLGYYDCDPLAFVSQWQSSKENGAPELRPELCPEGKFGYDPRCREWYDTGRKSFLENDTSFYLTPPYMYGNGLHAQSATAALVDPMTKRHVGQALVDFISTPIFEALNSQNTPFGEGGFPVMITPGNDNFGGDTVIAPGYSSALGSRPIGEVILAMGGESTCLESDCAGIEDIFETILKMKRGEEGLANLPLSTYSGSAAPAYVAYAPVKVKSLTPLDSSDFARGVNSTDRMIYSLALVETEQSILGPFIAIEEDVARQRNIALIILCTAIVLSTLLVVYLSSKFAASIANPMLYLLDLIRHINRLSADNVTSSSPTVDKNFGCREVRHVSSTMEVLYKVVRDANVAFFAGDIETAYAVLMDTLRLFQRLDNNKAIGVSNNNLGNMMLTMYRTMEATGEQYVCGFNKAEIVQKGVAYFHNAIKLGEASYDEFHAAEGWSPNCLEFMQHLSNRYFNRAMFLLTVKNSHNNPTELEELGFRDLQIVRDMDVEIVDEGTQAGWNVRTAEQLFDVKLGRIKGHLQLLEMGYPDDWEVDEQLEDAFQIVKDELKKESSELFEELNPAGRMQQIECELMKYMVMKDDLKTAGKIAIRMLLEDEYTLPDARTKAVEVLLAFVKSKDYENLDPDVEHELSNYQIWLSAMDEENDLRLTASVGPEKDDMSEVFQLSTAKFSTVSTRNDRENIRSSLKESTRGDFTMEVF